MSHAPTWKHWVSVPLAITAFAFVLGVVPAVIR